ncbi:MAG: hypothetical protein ABI200_02285 [Gaiellales bacterium]
MPQPEPFVVEGGGAPMPGDQPVEGGGDTAYEPAPEPDPCGQWIPAPVALEDTPPPMAPTGGDLPPEPIAGPDDTAPVTPNSTDSIDTPAAPATTPASQLATWPEWNAHFTRLGLPQEELAKLAVAPLNNEQLAEVYERIHTGIVAAGGIPGETSITPETVISAWSPVWEQRFLELGLPQEFVAELKVEAVQTGADDARIATVYETLVTQLKGASDVPGSPQGPIVQQSPQLPTTTSPQPQGAGWNPQIEQAFRSLGMPDAVIKIYAESGAPASGLEAAFKHASGRMEDLTERGWIEKLTAAKVDPLQMWSLILGDEPATDKELKALLNASKGANMGTLQKAGQLASSLFPGGRLAQYAAGKEFVSGQDIDRTSPMEIGMAALSGLALVASVRGARNLNLAFKARDAGYLQLNSVNNTLSSMGLPKTGTDAITDVALGATQTWGTKQKLISMIPGTTLHKQVIGLAHADAAAAAFNGGAAKQLMAKPDGALQVATLAQVFDDIKTGAMGIHGGSNAYLGPLKSSASVMSLDVSKGAEAIKVAKNIRLGGNGQTQLVGLLQVGGTKLGQAPGWLQSAPNIAGDIARLANVERQALGQVMAGSAVRTLDIGTFSKDGLRPMRMLAKLGADAQPEWYSRLAATTAGKWGAGVMPPEQLEQLTQLTAWGSILDEAGALIQGVDRADLTDGMRPLVDDAGVALDELKVAINHAKTSGVVDDATVGALRNFEEQVMKVAETDKDLALKLFPSYVDDVAFQRAHIIAGDQVLAAHGTNAVAAASNGVSDIVDDAMRTVVGPKPAATVAAPAAQVPLSVNGAGQAATPSGLIVPSYASPASGLAPADVSEDAIRRLADMMGKVRAGV